MVEQRVASREERHIEIDVPHEFLRRLPDVDAEADRGHEALFTHLCKRT